MESHFAYGPTHTLRGIELAASSLHFWYYSGRRAEGERWRELANELASRHVLTPHQRGLLDFASADFVAHSLLGLPAEDVPEYLPRDKTPR